MGVSIRSQGSTQEGGAQVDGDTRKPRLVEVVTTQHSSYYSQEGEGGNIRILR